MVFKGGMLKQLAVVLLTDRLLLHGEEFYATKQTTPTGSLQNSPLEKHHLSRLRSKRVEAIKRKKKTRV